MLRRRRRRCISGLWLLMWGRRRVRFIKVVLDDGARDAVFTARYIYSGRAAIDAASKMAEEGRAGLIVDVRFPYLHVLRRVARHWHRLSVCVDDQGCRSFRESMGRTGLPWQIETDQEQVDVVVWSETAKRVRKRELVRKTVPLHPDRVQMVVVHPRLQRFSVGPKSGVFVESSRIVRPR